MPSSCHSPPSADVYKLHCIHFISVCMSCFLTSAAVYYIYSLKMTSLYNFTQQDLKRLFANRFVVLIGDSGKFFKYIK